LEYATLDLKEASDRVSLALVREVFSQTPDLLRALEATRSSATTLPSGEVVTLKKFAPMGSALCFPVEAYCFWAILVASLARRDRVSPGKAAESVFVYGDDIIVPTKDADFCMQALESVKLVVNRSKSCILGPFRESCGMDAFKGHPVTPVRAKTRWSGRASDGSAYVSYVALMNNLASSGYQKCSDYVREKLEETYGRLPYGTSRASYPCVIVSEPETAEAYNAKWFKTRTKQSYQRLEFYVKTLRSSRVVSKLDSWTRLLRDIVMGVGDDPITMVVPRSIQIKRGWTPVM
jgi:hypothetical protein